VKKILSVSIGSALRDHTTRHVFLGQEFEITRQGTNGDVKKATQLYREMAGPGFIYRSQTGVIIFVSQRCFATPSRSAKWGMAAG
jgi:hypothetical protein